MISFDSSKLEKHRRGKRKEEKGKRKEERGKKF
jgi:hypothetical protein